MNCFYCIKQKLVLMTVGNVSCFSPIGHTAGGGGGILRRGSLHRPVFNDGDTLQRLAAAREWVHNELRGMYSSSIRWAIVCKFVKNEFVHGHVCKTYVHVHVWYLGCSILSPLFSPLSYKNALASDVCGTV